MSDFKCEDCGTVLYDTPDGYINACRHYPFADHLKLKEPCKKCEAIHGYTTKGRGPHKYKLCCENGHYIKWLNDKTLDREFN